MLVTCPKCSARYEVPPEISLKTGQKVQCSACEYVFELAPVAEETAPSVNLLPPEDAVLSINAKTEEIIVHTHEPEPEPVLDQKQAAPLPEAFQPVRVQQAKKSFPFGVALLYFVILICLVGIGWLWRDLLIMNRPFEASFMPARPMMPPVQEPKKQGRMPIRLEEHPPVVTHPHPVPPIEPLQQQPEAPMPEVNTPVLPTVQSVRFRKTPTNAVLIEGSLKNTSSETVAVPEKVYALAYGEDGTLLFEKEIHLPAGVLYPDMEQAFFGTYASEEKGVQWVDVVLTK